MKLKIYKSITRIKLTGLNFDKFFLIVTNNNIELFNLKKLEYNEILFDIKQSDLKRFYKVIKPLNYKIERIKQYGFGFLKNIFLKRIGVFVGLALSIAIFVLSNFVTINFTVLGLENLDKNEIISTINNFGVKKNKINHFNSTDLENYILEQIPQISMVSVMKKGTTILVNIKEKLPEIVDEYTAIYSDYNFVVEEISVYSGTAVVQIGDIVKKGDVLVEPYILSNGKKTFCKPVADITGRAYFTAMVEFQEKSIEFVRTGKQRVISSSVKIRDKEFLKSNNENTFENFEIENKSTIPFKNFFLPIEMKKTIAYETKQVEIVRDFEKERKGLESLVKQLAIEKVPRYLVVDEEKIIVTKNENKYYVNCYICCIIKIG